MGKELFVTPRDRQPYLKGLYTAALSADYLDGNVISDQAMVWISELANVLGASITVSPAITEAPSEWQVRDYAPAPCRRMVQLPTVKSRAVCCVDGRLADVSFVNQRGQLMDTLRIPGPDPDLLPEDNDMVIVQHGHCDPMEYGVEGEKSWEGCGWRTARVISLRVAGWDFFLLHDETGKFLGLRDYADFGLSKAA